MFSRIRKSVLKRWAAIRYPDGYFIYRGKHGTWLLNHHNFVDRHLGIFHDFENPQLDRLFSFNEEPVDAFLDIGANFGLYTLNAVYRGVARQYIAFEPDPRNAAQLAGNLYLNDAAQTVQLRRTAVSNKAGTVRMSLHPSTSTGTTRVVLSEAEGALDVSCIALDDEFPWQGRKLIIKIDVEGHEQAVLKGAMGLLRNNDCTVQIEIFSQNRTATLALMDEAGYAPMGSIRSDYYFRPASRAP